MKTDFFLHNYKNYDEYLDIQIEANIKKINKVWVSETNIKFLSKKILEKMKPKFGICHGTRKGLEQSWFMKYLKCKVIGTEISPTAKNYPNTVQWDFHEMNLEWEHKCDFIYTNSWDHAYDPKKAFCSWMQCLTKRGILILEHSTHHCPEFSNELDCFGASLDELIKFIRICVKENIKIDIYDAPEKKKSDIKFLFIERNI